MSLDVTKKEKAIFAAGCFWGVEHFFQQVKGVLETSVGYTGGQMQNPTYKDVSNGMTGHVEAVEIFFDPSQTTFKTLAKLFFEIHNPSLISNASGKRSQYRSAIFYHSEEQKKIAEKLVTILQSKHVEVNTQIREATSFYKAEEGHQGYYAKKGNLYEGRRCTPRF